MSVSLTVNGTRRQVDAPADTPLLYVLRNDLEIGSPQFGCGLSQCGACSVLVDGKEARACALPIRSVADKQITTIEGCRALGRPEGPVRAEAQTTLHPVQQAWIDQQVPMCGFCQYGMMIKAT
jgi:isoquinoline 1-oxidoreductase alpha subunit